MKTRPISLFVAFVGWVPYRFNTLYVLASPPFGADVVEERASVYESRSNVPDANSNGGTYAARHGPVFPQRYYAPRTRSCFEYDTEYWGSDIDRLEDGSVSTPAACQNICAKTTGCSFWTYFPRASSCHLKSADAFHGRTQRESAISGPRMCPCTNTCYEMDTDYPGSDVKKIEDHLVVSAAECHLLCQIEPLCHFWTWVSAEQNCYLKSEDARRRRVRAPGSISGPCDCPPTGSPSPEDDYEKRSPTCNEHGFVYSGAQEGVSEKVRHSQECQRLCQHTVTCAYFSYLPIENKCMLASSQGMKIDRPFAVSGPKYCPGSFCSEKGVQFYGKVVGEENKQSFASCFQQCSSMPHCSAVSYNTGAGTCLQVMLAEHNVSYVSGPKTCAVYDPNTGEPADVNTVTTTDFTGELFCYGIGTEYRNTELSVRYADSAESCQRDCRANPRCKFFTYYPYGNSCVTYETYEQRLRSDVAVSGPRECPVSTQACFYQGIEALGKDVGKCTTEDAIACREVCRKNKLCSVFAYDTVSHVCLQRQQRELAVQDIVSAPLLCDMPFGKIPPLHRPNRGQNHPEVPKSPQKPKPDLPEEDAEQPRGDNKEKVPEYPPQPLPIIRYYEEGAQEEPPPLPASTRYYGEEAPDILLPPPPAVSDKPPEDAEGEGPPSELGDQGREETEPEPPLPPESDEEQPTEVPPPVLTKPDVEYPMPWTSLPLDISVTEFEFDYPQGDEALPQARSGSKNAEQLPREPVPSTLLKASKDDAELPEAGQKSRHGASAEISREPPETGSHEEESVKFPPLLPPLTFMEVQKSDAVLSPKPAPRTPVEAPEWNAVLPGFEVQGLPDSPARILQPPESGPDEKEPVELPLPLTFMEAGNGYMLPRASLGHDQDFLTKVKQRPYAGSSAADSVSVIPTPAAEALLNNEEGKSVLTEASLDSHRDVFDDLHASTAENDPKEVPLTPNQKTRPEAPESAALLTEASPDGPQGTTTEVPGMPVDTTIKVPPAIPLRPSPRTVEKPLMGKAVLLGAVASNYGDSRAAVNQRAHADFSRGVPTVSPKPPAEALLNSEEGKSVLTEASLDSHRDVFDDLHASTAENDPKEVPLMPNEKTRPEAPESAALLTEASPDGPQGTATEVSGMPVDTTKKVPQTIPLRPSPRTVEKPLMGKAVLLGAVASNYGDSRAAVNQRAHADFSRGVPTVSPKPPAEALLNSEEGKSVLTEASLDSHRDVFDDLHASTAENDPKEVPLMPNEKTRPEAPESAALLTEASPDGPQGTTTEVSGMPVDTTIKVPPAIPLRPSPRTVEKALKGKAVLLGAVASNYGDSRAAVNQRAHADFSRGVPTVSPKPPAEALLNSEEGKSVLTEASLDSHRDVFDDLHASTAENDPKEVPLMPNEKTRPEAPESAAVLTEASPDGPQGTATEVSGMPVDTTKKVPPTIPLRPSPRTVEKPLMGKAVLLGAVASNYGDSRAAVNQRAHADFSRGIPTVSPKPPAEALLNYEEGKSVLTEASLDSHRDVFDDLHASTEGNDPKEVPLMPNEKTRPEAPESAAVLTEASPDGPQGTATEVSGMPVDTTKKVPQTIPLRPSPRTVEKPLMGKAVLLGAVASNYGDSRAAVNQRAHADFSRGVPTVSPKPPAEALLNSEEGKSVLTEASLDSHRDVFDDLHASTAGNDPKEVPLMPIQNTRPEAPKSAAVLTEASPDGPQGTATEVSGRLRAGMTVDTTKKVPPAIPPKPSPRTVEKALKGKAVLLGAVASNYGDSRATVNQRVHADFSGGVPTVSPKPPAKIMAKSQRGVAVLPDNPLQSRRDTSPPVARKPHDVRVGYVPRQVSVQSSLRKAEGMQKTKETSHEHPGRGGGPPAAQNSQTRARSGIRAKIDQFESLTSQGESRSTTEEPKHAPRRKHWTP